MGASVPKQFLTIKGKSILHATISVFTNTFPDVKVVTVLPEEHIPYWKKYCLENNFTVPQIIVKGGFTRFHSVKAALEKVPDGAIVAIHDGVRPLIGTEKIRELFAQAEKVPALIPVLPVTDTLKVLVKGSDGTLSATSELVDRSRLYGAQTPQLFHSEKLKAAYTQGYNTLFTDDASVAQQYGIPLTFTEGERYNLKITTPEDLVLAKAVMQL